MAQICAMSTFGQPVLFVMTITITLTGLQAVRVLENRGIRKSLGQKHDENLMHASLPIQYNFPYRFVFAVDHPISLYSQFLGSSPVTSDQYRGGNREFASNAYHSPVAFPQLASSPHKRRYLRQRQSQRQPPTPQQSTSASQAEFKYRMKPHLPWSPLLQNGVRMSSYVTGPGRINLLMHAASPTAESVPTSSSLPTSTGYGGSAARQPMHVIGAPFSPNVVDAVAAKAIWRAGLQPGSGLFATPAAATVAVRTTPTLHVADGHTKLVNAHLRNQLMMAHSSAGLHKLPSTRPLKAKYQTSTKSLTVPNTSRATGAGGEQSDASRSTSTESAMRFSDALKPASNRFAYEYIPENGPLAPRKWRL